jgi:hypothetical protein
MFGSTVDELVRNSGEIDVYVITGDQGVEQPPAPRLIERTSSWSAAPKCTSHPSSISCSRR